MWVGLLLMICKNNKGYFSRAGGIGGGGTRGRGGDMGQQGGWGTYRLFWLLGAGGLARPGVGGGAGGLARPGVGGGAGGLARPGVGGGGFARPGGGGGLDRPGGGGGGLDRPGGGGGAPRGMVGVLLLGKGGPARDDKEEVRLEGGEEALDARGMEACGAERPGGGGGLVRPGGGADGPLPGVEGRFRPPEPGEGPEEWDLRSEGFRDWVTEGLD